MTTMIWMTFTLKDQDFNDKKGGFEHIPFGIDSM